MWSWLKRQWQKWRIKRCNHPRPWIVLEVSKTIWWKAWIIVEFFEGTEPPGLGGIYGWCPARHLKCSKCECTLNEIELGKLWIHDPKHICIKSSPSYIAKLAKQCGTMKNIV